MNGYFPVRGGAPPIVLCAIKENSLLWWVRFEEKSFPNNTQFSLSAQYVVINWCLIELKIKIPKRRNFFSEELLPAQIEAFTKGFQLQLTRKKERKTEASAKMNNTAIHNSLGRITVIMAHHLVFLLLFLFRYARYTRLYTSPSSRWESVGKVPTAKRAKLWSNFFNCQ